MIYDKTSKKETFKTNLRLCECCYQTFTPNRVYGHPFCSCCKYPTAYGAKLNIDGSIKLTYHKASGAYVMDRVLVNYTREEFENYLKEFERSEKFL